MKYLGFVGLCITTASGVILLLTVTGAIHSPSFESMVATFIIGQSFYNGYLMAKVGVK